MLYFSRWQKAALVVLLLALAAGLGTLLYGRGRLAALDSGEPFFVDAPMESRQPAALLVHVSGAVAKPGIYHLPRGARLSEALEAAGGAAPEADLAALNLAGVLQDGEKIEVPLKQENLAPTEPPPTTGKPAAGTAAASKKPPKKPILLNSAGAEEFAQLPGIGPILAERIIQYRERLKAENGKGFQSKEQLLEVPGIGPKKYADLRKHVTL
jgi:competence protein ComEA